MTLARSALTTLIGVASTALALAALVILMTMIIISLFPQNADAIAESNYEATMYNVVIPELNARLQRNTFRAFDGKLISYALIKQQNARGTIVLSPGRTESIVGYSELIYDLYKHGYSVAVIDHRGQGYSDRLAPSDVGHVGKFEDYVKDFTQFIEEKVRRTMPQPYFLLASSMGGAIATHYLIDNPGVFRSAVLAAPMFRVLTGGVPDWFVHGLAYGLHLIGRGEMYAPSMGPYSYDQVFEGNYYTSSELRFRFDITLTRLNPTIAVGGPSPMWISEALAGAAHVMKNTKKIKTPVLMIQAGADSIVENASHVKFCNEAPNCKLIVYPRALHWIFMESDSIRDRILENIEMFFNDSSPAFGKAA